MASNSNSSNLAKFAFNIYGTLNNSDSNNPSPPSSSSSAKSNSRLYRPGGNDNLLYNCEKEVNTLTELELIPNNGFSNNVVIGGKNYLKLLILNHDQSAILNETNILEPISNTNSRLPGSNKLYNFNTIKSYRNTVAGGMVNGTVILYQVLNNGKSRVLRRYTDHKRCINSLDFLDPMTGESSSNLLISGSQDGSIRLWDLRQSSDKPAVNIVPKSNYDAVRSCQFSSHSMVRNKLVILSVHDSGTLNKYDIRSYGQSSQSQVVPERKWNFHTGPGLSLSIHPEKEYVITGGRDQKVCVWNYGESQSSYNSTTPDYVLQTYGPVMKVRWCPYPNAPVVYDYDDDVSYDDKELRTSSTNSLFNYDFACSYLNEDPTITVYNLKRKYVPKEIINSYSNKPYQNYIWAKNPEHQRKIWTLTKGNQFSSRSLDTGSDLEYITRPHQILNPVSMDWGTSVGNLSFIAQEKCDFENNETNDKYNSETSVDPIPDSDIDSPYNDSTEAGDYNKLMIGSAPQNTFSAATPVYTSGTSPVDTPLRQPPLLTKSSTFSGAPFPSNKLSTGSPPTRNAFNHLNLEQQRPALGGRNPSQSTIDSTLSVHSPVNKSDSAFAEYRKTISIYHASPYVIPLSLPIPANDDVVFETLSNNYLLTIPDGFSLVDVCLLNASVAASVNRFKDCQIWRMLSVGLGQHVDGYLDEEEQDRTFTDAVDPNESRADTEVDDNNDTKSISSEYGIVGSYNSNSTNNTNYDLASESTSEKKSSNPNSWTDMKSSSTNNLMDMINQNRNNSLNNSITIGALSPNASRSNSMINHVNTLRLTAYKADDNENAVEDDDDEAEKAKKTKSDIPHTRAQISTADEERASTSPGDEGSGQPLRRHSSVPNMFNGNGNKGLSRSPSKSTKKFGTSPKNMAILNRIRPKRDSFVGSFSNTANGQPNGILNTDLDNENLNVLNNAVNSSLSSSNVSVSQTLDNRSSMGSVPSNYFGSFKSRRSSSIAPTYGFLNNRPFDNELEEVDETTSADSSRIDPSGLTKAIEEEKGFKHQDSKLEIPWTISNLLEKALDHATLQGDVILCSSLSLLFYPFIKPLALNFINKEFCLQWLSLYIEILNKKRLFVNSTNILNIAPRELQEQLLKFYYGDNLKFYCQHCNELIVNEDTKQKFNEGKTKQFGYWFCEKCRKWQSNCIYCNEPCIGLNVVISLKCGHRGHFGCLKEWFIEDDNLDCPGGCNETLF